MNLSNLLNLLNIVGPVIAAAPQFKAVWDEAVDLLHPTDQATAKEALADLVADNATGYARLHEKLVAAAQQ